MYSYPPTNAQQQYSQNPQYSQYPQSGSAWYAPMPTADAQPAKARKGSGGSGGKGGWKKPRKRKSMKWAFIKLFLVLVALGGLGTYGYIYKIQSDVRPYLNVFLDNISVDGINLSGMTWEEGSQAVLAQANAKQSGWYVRVRSATGESKDITADMLGIHFDPTHALEEAWAIGHETSTVDRKTIFELKEEILQMKSSSAEFYSYQQDADTSPIDTIMQTLEDRAYKAPQDAAVLSFNPDDTQNPFTFQPEQIGQRLDTTAVKQQILEMVQTFESGEVLLQPEPIAPEITLETLQKQYSLLFRAYTPIDRHSTEERTNNIRHAFSKINGLEIKSGSKFSFNNLVGRRTVKNGFFEANEYAYGELVMGVGGGVCQASTTVFLAAIQSGMSVEKREPHSGRVSYTDLGKDATVSDTKGHEIDFVFKNTSEGSIFISAHVIQDNAKKNSLLCEVRIYGMSLGNTSYSLEAVQTQLLPKPSDDEAEIIQDTKATYVTFTDEQKVVLEAKEGYVIETYLRTLVDGVMVDRKLLYTDTYPNRKARIYVGVTPRW